MMTCLCSIYGADEDNYMKVTARLRHAIVSHCKDSVRKGLSNVMNILDLCLETGIMEATRIF